MMNLILEEEKLIENSLQCEEFPESLVQENVVELDGLERMLKQSENRIDAILQAIQVYKENVQKVTGEIDGIETLIREFVEAKNKLLEIATKVRRLPYFRQAVSKATSAAKSTRKTLKAMDIESIRMFLSLFAEDSEG
jgi:DNA repair ATPase RecN